jgi:hypothetical protein
MARVVTRAGIILGAVAVFSTVTHDRAGLAHGQPVVPGIVPGGTTARPPGLDSPPPPRDPARPTGTARLRGRVVAADTGQPLRRALVGRWRRRLANPC